MIYNRIDVFPTIDGAIAYKNAPVELVAAKIQDLQTNAVELNYNSDGSITYIHYKNFLKTDQFGKVFIEV